MADEKPDAPLPRSSIVDDIIRTAEEQEQRFLAQQQANTDDAAAASDRMAEGGTPEGKRPL